VGISAGDGGMYKSVVCVVGRSKKCVMMVIAHSAACAALEFDATQEGIEMRGRY
jgi:hypothetical protein